MRHLMRASWLALAALAGALAVIAAVLLPPLSVMADMLFAAHMAQHLLLIAVAAPLLVLSGFVPWRVGAVTAWCLFVGVFLFWHWPAAFQWAALRWPTQLFELATILTAALGFWSMALGDNELHDGARALAVVTAAIATDLPGVVMLFAPRAICTMPGENAARFGLTPLQDQQIAGLLMWVPANLAFFGIATFLFARWLSDSKPLVTS